MWSYIPYCNSWISFPYYWCTEVVHQHWNFYGKGTIFGDFLKITGISNQLHIWDLISTWIDICNAIWFLINFPGPRPQWRHMKKAVLNNSYLIIVWLSGRDKLFESPIMLCSNAPMNILLCQCKMSYFASITYSDKCVDMVFWSVHWWACSQVKRNFSVHCPTWVSGVSHAASVQVVLLCTKPNMLL